MAKPKFNRRWIIVIALIVVIVIVLAVVLGGSDSSHHHPPAPSKHHSGPVPPGPNPPGPPAPSGSGTSSSQAQEWVNAHNKYRAMAGAPPLRWNENLAGWAKAWGDHLAANNCDFCHPGYCVNSSSSEQNQYLHGNSWGQNLAKYSGSFQGSPSDAVKGWFDECVAYDPSNPHNVIPGYTDQGSPITETGHYSQLMWKDTTEVGCAISDCGGAKIYTCNYNPTGNIIWNDGYSLYNQNVKKVC